MCLTITIGGWQAQCASACPNQGQESGECQCGSRVSVSDGCGSETGVGAPHELKEEGAGAYQKSITDPLELSCVECKVESIFCLHPWHLGFVNFVACIVFLFLYLFWQNQSWGRKSQSCEQKHPNHSPHIAQKIYDDGRWATALRRFCLRLQHFHSTRGTRFPPHPTVEATGPGESPVLSGKPAVCLEESQCEVIFEEVPIMIHNEG